MNCKRPLHVLDGQKSINRRKLSPEEIARKGMQFSSYPMAPLSSLSISTVAEERALAEAALSHDIIKVENDDSVTEGQGGLTFDDTSEFVRAISYNPAAVKAEPIEPSVARASSKATFCQQRYVTRIEGKQWKRSKLGRSP